MKWRVEMVWHKRWLTLRCIESGELPQQRFEYKMPRDCPGVGEGVVVETVKWGVVGFFGGDRRRSPKVEIAGVLRVIGADGGVVDIMDNSEGVMLLERVRLTGKLVSD